MMRLYALTAIILALKMSAIWIVQGRARTGAKKFANPEDAAMFGGTTVPQEVAGVQRAHECVAQRPGEHPDFPFPRADLCDRGTVRQPVHRLLRGLHHRAHPAYDLLSECDAAVAHDRIHVSARSPCSRSMIHLFVGFVIVGGD